MKAAARYAREWLVELLILPLLLLLAAAVWTWRMGEITPALRQHLVNQAASTQAARTVLAARMASGPIRNYEIGPLVQVLQALHEAPADASEILAASVAADGAPR